MGWGYKHTPAYIPDPRDPSDMVETAISHAVYGTATWAAASLLVGQSAGPGHLGLMARALFSPAHVGAAGAGTNALADTVYAMRVYSTPFRIAARASAPLVAAAGIAGIVALQTEAMRDFSAHEQVQILSGVATPKSSTRHKLFVASGFGG